MENADLENSHLKNLVKKAVHDFDSTVGKETSPSNILLRGHLYIENLLDENLAVFDIHPREIEGSTFHSKVKKLRQMFKNEAGEGKRGKELEKLIYQLFSLNRVRNSLAHDLSFSVDETSVDRIGICLGSEYIEHKYKIGQDNVAENLSYCLSIIVATLTKSIFVEIEVKKEVRKKRQQKAK